MMSNYYLFNRVFLTILILILINNVSSSFGNENEILANNNNQTARRDFDLPWYQVILKQLQRTLFDCRRKTGAFNSLDYDYDVSIVKMKNCVKEVSLDALDHALNAESIPLNTYVSMVKERNATENYIGRSKEDAVNEDIASSLYKRMFGLVQSHSFKVDLYPLTSNEDQVEGRRRRRYRKAFPMMVAGFMMMSAILVPLGFQFMAVIGGKALLLAKLAFIIAVTSGYRRIADHLDYHHHDGHHDYHHRSSDITPIGAYPQKGRRRHQYRKAFPMMVAGFMMMSAFLVPMGFQFMAMIGGKALLLAKLAFIMSVTGGYRRIADHLDYHHHHDDHHHDYHHPHDYLHHLGYHRSSDNTPMTGAYAFNGQNYLPLLKKG